MNFQMDRESGLVEFTGVMPGSIITVTFPEPFNDKGTTKMEVKVDEEGIAALPFADIREQFLRKSCSIIIEHEDYEPIQFEAEIRMTKLIQKPISKQIKKKKEK